MLFTTHYATTNTLKVTKKDTKMYMKQGSVKPSPPWHRVEEPPEEDGYYLVCIGTGKRFWWEKAYFTGGEWLSNGDEPFYLCGYPDYWMPIEPPKEGV